MYGGFTEDVKAKLKALCIGADALKAGRVQFVGLDRLKMHFGADWMRHQARAFAVAQRVLQRRLRPVDVYWEMPGSGFVFVSGDASAQEAQLRCAMIGDEIGRLLMGEDALSDMISVKTVVSELSDGILGLVPEMPGPLASAASTAPPSQAGGAGGPEEWDLGHDLDRPAGNGAIGFRPIWDTKRNVIVAYRYLSGFSFREGVGNTSAADEAAPPIQADLMILGDVVTRTVAEFRKGLRFLIAVPVHFASFRRTTDRLVYLHALNRLSHTMRSHLLLTVIGMGDAVPQSRLVEVISPLRNTCRSVVVNVERLTAPMGWLAGAGAHAVSCDVENANDAGAQVLQSINRFAAEAERIGVKSYLSGIEQIPAAVAAACAGVDFIDGDIIGPACQVPGGPMRYSPRDLYQPATVGAPDSARRN